jgi:hypothetical protein
VGYNVTLLELKRNDVPAALAYCHDRGGEITGAEWRVLVLLQDEPKAIRKAIRDEGIRVID